MNSIEFEIDLSGRKEGKADKLAKGFKKLFEQYNFNLDTKRSSDEEFVLKVSDSEIEIIIGFDYDFVSVEIKL